jgi:hypothetical protein
MTTAITVRLDETDHASLTRQAEQLRVRPGTLARMLVHAGLQGAGDESPSDPRAALDRLVRRSRTRPPADAVALVADARAGLAGER